MQDDESDGFLSESSSVFASKEPKNSFFQSSLHNRKIELTLSQTTKLKLEMSAFGIVRNYATLLVILGNLSASILKSLELTWQ